MTCTDSTIAIANIAMVTTFLSATQVANLDEELLAQHVHVRAGWACSVAVKYAHDIVFFALFFFVCVCVCVCVFVFVFCCVLLCFFVFFCVFVVFLLCFCCVFGFCSPPTHATY